MHAALCSIQLCFLIVFCFCLQREIDGAGRAARSAREVRDRLQDEVEEEAPVEIQTLINNLKVRSDWTCLPDLAVAVSNVHVRDRNWKQRRRTPFVSIRNWLPRKKQ